MDRRRNENIRRSLSSLYQQIYKRKIFPNKETYSIRTMALKNGFHKTKEKSVKWYDKEKMISDLKTIANKIGRTPLFVEYFGLPEKDSYKKRMEEKKSICKDNRIILVCLYRGDMNKLSSIFEKFIKKDS